MAKPAPATAIARVSHVKRAATGSHKACGDDVADLTGVWNFLHAALDKLETQREPHR